MMCFIILVLHNLYIYIITDDVYSNGKKMLLKNVRNHVVNLRKYLIVGGVFYLNIFHQPPQPWDKVSFHVRLTACKNHFIFITFLSTI